MILVFFPISCISWLKNCECTPRGREDFSVIYPSKTLENQV